MIEIRIMIKPAKERVKALKRLLDRIEAEIRRHGYVMVSHEVRHSDDLL